MWFPAFIKRLFDKRPWLFFLVFLIYTIFIGGSGWVIAWKTTPGAVITEQTTKTDQDSPMALPTEPQMNCEKKNFSESEREWDEKFYKKGKDGYWCPVKFLDPVMWHKEGIDTNFKTISLEYKIKRNISLKTNNPPSFIFAYGKEDKNEVPIFKLWVPENPNLQLFGFAKNLNFDSEKPKLDREESIDLPDPVKTERNDTFTITSTRVEGNEMLLDLSYHYTSDVNKEDQNKNIPKVVKLPVSNAPVSSKKFSIGIGTYVGNCIGEISYEICQ